MTKQMLLIYLNLICFSQIIDYILKLPASPTPSAGGFDNLTEVAG
jgi:hypothetical protein